MLFPDSSTKQWWESVSVGCMWTRYDRRIPQIYAMLYDSLRLASIVERRVRILKVQVQHKGLIPYRRHSRYIHDRLGYKTNSAIIAPTTLKVRKLEERIQQPKEPLFILPFSRLHFHAPTHQDDEIFMMAEIYVKFHVVHCGPDAGTFSTSSILIELNAHQATHLCIQAKRRLESWHI